MPDSQQDNGFRPSPDALLEMARREGSHAGKLKIFVGAAPGVGKTYEMLLAAQALRRDGYDLVAGIVETHGRKETEALLDNLEIIPRQQIEYKGRWLVEMDLDAILARRPQIVLVDELAHTNAPGSRHPKRYLDIEELLGAGINVHTTVNIQHIESLNDVVAQITRIRVRETVPDTIFDRADAIELVDLTPDDLIERLREGKVYVPKQAKRALEHYFSPSNLTALRELAMRRSAERVDEQLLAQMQAHGIRGPWAAGERVLVCVSQDPRGAGLVRYARRMADRRHAPWTALYVETRRSLQFSEVERDRIADTLRLAQALGGETVTIPGGDRRIADDILAFAEANNITQILIGKSKRSRSFEILHGSVVHDLVRRSKNIGVHVVAGGAIEGEPIPKKTVTPAAKPQAFDSRAIGFSLLAVAGAVGISELLWPWVRTANIDLVFLTAIVGVAVRFGLWPSLVAIIVSAVCYNFFFTEPYYDFTIADPANVIAVVFFTIVAIIVSNVAARARIHAIAATLRARTAESLYTFSRKLAGVGALDEVLWVAASQTALMLKARVVLLLPVNGSVAVKTAYPSENILDQADLAAANWAWQSNRPAGRGSDTLPGARRLFLPMRTGRGILGVVGLDSDKPGPLFTPDERRLLDALIDQSALAIERVHLVQEMDKIKRTVETERLRTALLNSISHDLKTPLAVVLGAAGTLRDLPSKLTEGQKAELLKTILDESERLHRFIANLLDMSKLETGAVIPKTSPHDLGEIVGSALGRAAAILAEHEVEVKLAVGLPMLELDAVLFEQALFNLLDNAAKYAPENTMICIKSWCEPDWVFLQVLDEGDGIPPEDLEHIFDKFYRAQKGDRVRAGTGLGLAICRGFIDAMNGTITAANRGDRKGAVLTIRLPIPAEPRQLDTDA